MRRAILNLKIPKSTAVEKEYSAELACKCHLFLNDVNDNPLLNPFKRRAVAGGRIHFFHEQRMDVPRRHATDRQTLVF